MFPPSRAITLQTAESWPGLSYNIIVKEQLRPLFVKPRVITRLRILTSILPPETTHTTFLPSMGTLLNIAAATDTAPAPSATSFCCSIKLRIAAAISSSDTVTTSSTYLRHISNVLTPGSFTAIPSAIVETLESLVMCPSCRD